MDNYIIIEKLLVIPPSRIKELYLIFIVKSMQNENLCYISTPHNLSSRLDKDI